jgi:capping protein alpha
MVSVGDWVSKWELTSTELKGDVNIQAHYYEEGNVQLKNLNKFQTGVNINLAAAEDSAKAVIDALSKFENRHQDAMDKVYTNMPDLFFKAMRRVLPGTLLIIIRVSNGNQVRLERARS